MKKTTPITKVLTTNCTIIEAKADLYSVQTVFNHFPYRFLPVVNGLEFVGVIFRDEFFQKCLQHPHATMFKAKDFVSKEMVILSPQNTLEEAKEVFDAIVYDILPVTDAEGDLMGVLLRENVEAAYHPFILQYWGRSPIMQRVMAMLAF